MWVQNEIGTINPVQEIAEACFSRGVTFHTDATQALGRIPISLKDTKITYLSASAHKVYGPKGIGLLYHNENLISDVPPFFKGGGHESGLRSGTLATPLIAGFGKACEIISDPKVIEDETKRILALRQTLCDGLVKIFDDLKINTCFEQSVANYLHLSWNQFRLPRVFSHIAVSRGSACSSQKADWMSPTLISMGLTQEQISNSLRITLGRFTTLDDIHNTIEIFKNLKDRTQITSRGNYFAST
jgi:cysteine desulfurase